MTRVIVCLGVESLATGPFETDKEIDDELWMHMGNGEYCSNGSTKDDHNILDLKPGFFSPDVVVGRTLERIVSIMDSNPNGWQEQARREIAEGRYG